MKKKYIALLFCYLLFMAFGNKAYAQVTFGSLEEPDPDAVLDLRSGGTKGLLLPRLALVDVNDPAPLSGHKAGMLVYNTGTNVPQGYYYNDGFQWVLITDTKLASWNSLDTKQGATSNTDNIYQMGGVSIGASDIDSQFAKFSVASESGGFLTPRLTSQQINEITQQAPVGAPDGLFVYNLTTKCFSYYDGENSKWVSLCSETEPSDIVVESCDAAGPFPNTADAYKALSPLTSNHFYRIKLRVNEPGAYSVRINTENGYSFEKSGTFTETGVYTLDLPGQGIPENEANPGDVPTVLLNGTDITASLSCQLPIIPVAPADVVYEVDCNQSSSIVVYGEHIVGESLSRNEHYIELALSVSVPGVAVIETEEKNGIVFRSDVLNLVIGDTTVYLYGAGTPTQTGTYTYTPAGANCSVSVDVGTNLGNFDNPAINCLAIYELGVRDDGEYWVSIDGNSNTPVRTMCDMTNGGYTLVWSYSEKTLRDTIPSTTAGMSMHNAIASSWGLQMDRPQNQVFSEGGEINYYNYRLATTTMKSIAEVGNKTNSLYRFRIAYDPKDMDDAWGNENYFVIDFAGSSTSAIRNEDLLRTTATGGFNYDYTGPKVDGKVFNVQWSKNGINGQTTFNNVQRSGTSGAFYYDINCAYGHHWDYGGLAVSTSTSITTTITTVEGNQMQIAFNPSWINNFWGTVNAETNLNHHIGKCTGSTDEYSFTSTTASPNICTPANQYPHSFNPVYNTTNPSVVDYYHGRVFQWWVK